MNDASAPVSEDVIDLSSVVRKIREKAWWVFASIVLFTCLAVAAALLLRPVYRVSTVLAPASPERGGIAASLNSALGTLGGLAGLAGLNLDGGMQTTEESLAVLRSRQFTEKFIVEEQLLPKLFASRWNQAQGRWNVDEDEIPTLAKAYKYFDRRIRAIIRDKKTGLVTVQIEWSDREEAARWANELVRRLNAEMRARAIRNAGASLGYLEKELASTSAVETRDAINRLVEAQVKQRMLANVTEEYAFRVVDRAMPPDADDPVRPRKLLMVAAGPVIGGVLGVTLVLVFAALGRSVRGTVH